MEKEEGRNALQIIDSFPDKGKIVVSVFQQFFRSKKDFYRDEGDTRDDFFLQIPFIPFIPV